MFEAILSPFRWLMSWLLGAFHSILEFAGLPADSGWTWALSILLLVVLIRTLLIPLFVKQIKAQRAMQAIQPELQKLQAKYKGKKDQLSRQAMAMEQQALMKEHKANPFAACLPLLIQMPFFFALYQVLIGARGADGLVAALTTALYPAVTARLCAATETLRLRYVQHVRAAPVADVLAADDMDAVHDWDLVQAGARFLDATRDVEQLLSDALATTHALDGPSDALHEAALRSIPAAGARVAEDIAPPTKLIHAAQSFVLELLLSAFRRHVEAYAAHGAWTMQERLGDARVKVPTFSRSPTEGMVRLGEGLLNLPRLLEALVERELRAFQYAVDELPFAHDDEGASQRATRRSHRSLSVSMLTGGAPADEGGVATADHVLSLWLRSLTLTLLAALRDETLPRIAAQHNCDRAQLAADLDYLGNIASALNASCPPLRAWVDVLQLEGPAPADSPLRATRAHAVVWGVVRG